MIVVHITNTLDGGAGIGMWRYHQALVDAGVDSRILIMHPPAGHDGRISQVRWRKHPLPLRLAHRLGVALPAPERFKQRIANLDRRAGQVSYELFTVPFSDYCAEDHPWIGEADLINIHWVAGLLDWPRFFNRVDKPVAITLHDQQPYLGGFHYAQDAEDNLHLAALEASFRDLKLKALRSHRVGVVANSKWNAGEAYASGFFAPGTLIETIYYPLDTDVFRPQSKPSAKTAAGIETSRRVIGFACENLSNSRKGFDELLTALTLLPEAVRTNITLLSFGRAPSPELRARVTLPWVHLGFLKEDAAKVAAYAAMDVFVVPSRAEAFGLTALEAGAVGIPVVATRVGGLVEAVPVAITPGPENIRDAIVELLANDTLSASRAEAGRQLAVERHSPAIIGAQLIAFFATLAE